MLYRLLCNLFPRSVQRIRNEVHKYYRGLGVEVCVAYLPLEMPSDVLREGMYFVEPRLKHKVVATCSKPDGVEEYPLLLADEGIYN